MTLSTAFFGVLQFFGQAFTIGEVVGLVLLVCILRSIRAIG